MVTFYQFICGMTTGHTYVRLYQPRRLGQRCIACQHETAGWEVGRTGPVERETGVLGLRECSTNPTRAESVDRQAIPDREIRWFDGASWRV
jgi:hypothetical protein